MSASFQVQQDALWDVLCETRTAVEYCLKRTADIVQRKDGLAATAFHRAGLLLGCDGTRARGIIGLCVRKKGYDGAQAWLAEPPALPAIVTTPSGVACIGFVYQARLLNFPHVIKIGFSSHPERRMKELEYAFGQPFKLDTVSVGTQLDEARAHIDAGKRYITREFMFDPLLKEFRPSMAPPFLLGGLANLLEYY